MGESRGSPFAQGVGCQGSREIPQLLGVHTHPETPGNCLCLGQSYSIKTFAVPTSSLVTLNNHELHLRARFKQTPKSLGTFPHDSLAGRPDEQVGVQSVDHFRWGLRLGGSTPSAQVPTLKLDSLYLELDPGLPISLGSQLHVHNPPHTTPSCTVRKVTVETTLGNQLVVQDSSFTPQPFQGRTKPQRQALVGGPA